AESSLSRRVAQDDWRCRFRVRPYGCAKPWVAATISEAESVRGMKPRLSTHFSGASLPATQARLSGRMVFCLSVMSIATYQQNGVDPGWPESTPSSSARSAVGARFLVADEASDMPASSRERDYSRCP